MAAWNGRPVLARLYAHDVPTIPAMNTAISGRFAAIAVVAALASRGDLANSLAFDEAVRVAQGHGSYEYSRAFLETAHQMIAELNLMFPTPADDVLVQDRADDVDFEADLAELLDGDA
jgi:hypothetical protein